MQTITSYKVKSQGLIETEDLVGGCVVRLFLDDFVKTLLSEPPSTKIGPKPVSQMNTIVLIAVV